MWYDHISNRSPTTVRRSTKSAVARCLVREVYIDMQVVLASIGIRHRGLVHCRRRLHGKQVGLLLRMRQRRCGGIRRREAEVEVDDRRRTYRRQDDQLVAYRRLLAVPHDRMTSHCAHVRPYLRP